jgi:hypothetical protein
MRTASGSSFSLCGKPFIGFNRVRLYFMSIEVAAQEFLFLPPSDDVDITDFMEDFTSTSDIQNPTSAVPFSHNYLHDLESLWWVAVWLVLFNHFSKAQGLGDEPPFELSDAEHQLRLAEVLFPSVLKSADRQIRFQHSLKQIYVIYRATKQSFAVI